MTNNVKISSHSRVDLIKKNLIKIEYEDDNTLNVYEQNRLKDLSMNNKL